MTNDSLMKYESIAECSSLCTVSLPHGADIVKFLLAFVVGGHLFFSENNTCSIIGFCEFEPWSGHILSLRLLIQIGQLMNAQNAEKSALEH